MLVLGIQKTYIRLELLKMHSTAVSKPAAKRSMTSPPPTPNNSPAHSLVVSSKATSIAILHEELEWAEHELKRQLEANGFPTQLIDIRSANQATLFEYDVVLNRIYPTASLRDHTLTHKALQLTKALEERKRTVLNSSKTSAADYSKYQAFVDMKNHGVTTPETWLVTSKAEAKEKIEELPFPLVLKRDTGGRSFGVELLANKEAAQQAIQKLDFSVCRYVFQEFVRSNHTFDVRIAIANNEFFFSYGRTLQSLNGEPPWLASSKRGSKDFSFQATEEQIAMAKKATRAIGAFVNEVDVCLTENGPIIIENNPTAQYGDTLVGNARIRKFIHHVIHHIKGSA